MRSKSPARSCEDFDDVTLNYAEIKALCAGNPLIKEKVDLEVSVTKLKALKSHHVNEQYRLEDNVLKYFPTTIRNTENRIKGYENDINSLKGFDSQQFSPMTVMGTEYADKGEAGKALLEACKSVKPKETLDIGSYKGFEMSMTYKSGLFELELKGDMTYFVELGGDPHGSITRINNCLSEIAVYFGSCTKQLETYKTQLENAKSELGKPFLREDELSEKLTRLAELTALLNVDGKDKIEVTKPESPAAA